MIKLKKLYKLLLPLTIRDIEERYAGSSIGVFWTFSQAPRAMVSTGRNLGILRPLPYIAGCQKNSLQ